MNLENKTNGVGKVLLGFLLGMLLAALSPLMIITEIFTLMMVINLPAVGLMLLYRWAGLAPALLSAMLQLMLTARMLGGTFMWVAFFAGILPLVLLLRCEKKQFYTQVKVAIAAFGGGVVLAVTMLYLKYGGNMIERVLMELPSAMREIPVEMLAPVMKNMEMAIGRTVAAEDFYSLFENMIASLVPVYQVNMPGLLFSGALASAVLCAGIGSMMLKKQGRSVEGAYLPLRRWALPPSVTGGLLLITGVSYVTHLFGLPQGRALFFATYNIAAAAFCVQALSSMARHMYASSMKKGMRTFILAGIAILSMMGASLYVAMYGCASAIWGRYGALRQRYDKNNSQNNNHSNDEYRR